MPRYVPLLLLAACSAAAPAAEEPPAQAQAPAPPAIPVLAPEQEALLQKWYDAVGPRRAKERFGELVARAGMVQLGKPYSFPPDKPGPEAINVDLTSFECVTFVESSLSVARCTWAGTRDGACFLREIEGWRYRGGKIGDFASRLHYFSDWLADNAARGHLHPLTAELGGVAKPAALDWVTKHPERYPALADPSIVQQISAIEARLSQVPQAVLNREQIAGVESRLEDGDVIAFVGDKPGLMITHTGLVHRGKDGVVRVLHASSWHNRIILTAASLANYIERRPERLGLVLSRPLPPVEAPSNAVPAASVATSR